MENNTTSEDVLIISDVPLTEEEQQALVAEAERLEKEKQDALDMLARKIEGDFVYRSGRRRVKEDQWLRSSRLYLGSKSAQRGNSLTTEGGSGASRPDHNLVAEKCKLAIAQSWSGQFGGGDKNWDIKPSPVPSTDPAQAAQAARNMSRKIEDYLNDTKYSIEARKAMEDRVILGTGILKGPVPTLADKVRYEVTQDPDGKLVTIPTFEFVPKPIVKRVDPWFFYPDDTVADFEDCEDAIEVHPMSKTQLAKLARNPGFNAEAIAEICKTPPAEYNSLAFQDANALTDSGENYLRNKYVVMERHGPISIDEMEPLGLSPTFDAIGNTYFGEIWICNGKVIRAALESVEGSYELPYAVSPWSPDPNSVFGFSLPLDAEDSQRIHTASLHMALDNASISSGPMVVVNKEYIEPADGKWEFKPHKLFFTTDSLLQNVGQAFQTFTVDNVSGNLFPIMERAEAWAQQETGINLLSAGIGSPQVGPDSATGLSILNQQATVVTDMLNEAWDDQVTQKIIRRMYHWVLQYDPTPDVFGDFEVDVKSSTELRANQMTANNLEKLSVEAGQNQMLAEMLNMDQLVRARLTNYKVPNNGIVKSEEQVQQEQQAKAQQPPPPDPNMVKLQIEQGRLEMEAKRLELEDRKLQFQMEQEMQKFQMEQQTRQEQIQARREDYQARIIQANIEKEIEMLRLAQRDTEVRTKIMADLEKNNMNLETQKFLKGMEINDNAQDRLIAQRELLVKEQTGSGI